RIPAMAPLIEQGDASLRAARESLTELARTLGA
ncbi:MAG: azoR, partial [Rhodococcus erythropolis]|nr:azoR [Rhodococcus erythropolis]